MAASDGLSLVAGTPVVWKDSGGSFVMTLASLSSVTGRQGPKSATLLQIPPGLATAVMPDLLEFRVDVTMTSAPTAGQEFSLYLGFSDSATAGTDNPAGLSGTDAAGPNTDTFPQLVFAGSVVLSNNLGTAKQSAILQVIPKDLYVAPVAFNGAGVATSATANSTVITMIPWYRVRST